MNHAEIIDLLAQRITSLFPVDMIYLLGQREVTYSTTTISIKGIYHKTCLDQAYLLVVIPDLSTNKKHVLEERIENSCADQTAVTAIVLDAKQLRHWISTKHPFASEAISDNRLVYRAGNAEGEVADKSQALYDYEAFFRMGRNRANEFLIGADLYRIRKQYKMAAFMLHQAAEQALLAMLALKTGLRFDTHNIFKLSQYCGMVEPEFCQLLYGNSEPEKKAIRMLRSAYTKPRYGDNFEIDGGCLIILIDKISRLTSGLTAVNQH